MLWARSPGKVLGAIALAVAGLGLVIPNAPGVVPSGPSTPQNSAPRSGTSGHHGRALTNIIRVERDFTVEPHSLAANQLLPCPAGTALTGGGTSLIGEPSTAATAPVLYTNGPVGTILPDNEQTWASEVANNSDETFTYRQFALCAESRTRHQG
jgi:hypothetical protein